MKNVVNVLKVLNSGENYFIGIEDYKRIGNEVVDNFDLFERKEISTPTPFELIGHDNRLNLSVANKIYGEVKMNPRQAKKVGLPTVITGPMQFKNKSIVRDGELNAPQIELIVDVKTYMVLKKECIGFQELKNETSYPGYHIILDLSGMPIADTKTDYTLEEILGNVTKINELKAKQKVLNALIKQLPKVEETSMVFNEEQLEMLKDHGLDANLNYRGVDVEIKETEESYEGLTIEFKVKGSSMSSFATVLKRVKNGDKLNAMDTIQYDFYKELNENVKLMEITADEDLRTYYGAELKKIKGELFNLRLRNVMIKLAFMNSELKETAVDTADGLNYKGLNISLKTQTHTK